MIPRARRETVIVLGQMAKYPVGGVIWQTIHYVLGLQLLGYDVHYVEAHGAAPHSFMRSPEDPGSEAAAAFIAGVMSRFGVTGAWAYEAIHADGALFGTSRRELRRLFDSAALVINLCGCTDPRELDRTGNTIVYLGTDPCATEIELASGNEAKAAFLATHSAFFTFGENYGNAGCGIPVSNRFLFRTTRQPVICQLWEEEGPLPSGRFTTVGNWHQGSTGIEWRGERYTWSKDLEFQKVIDLPARLGQRFELALGKISGEQRRMLEGHGWVVRDGLEVSRDADSYRAYIAASRGEFTVAKDQNVRLRSGWFSDRAATYLAAGRPVITQDTGFGEILPTGEGLFPFTTADDVLHAVERIDAEPERHSRAAREIAREYFSHDVVLGRLVSQMGLAIPGRPRAVAQPRPAELPRALPLSLRARRPATLPALTEQAVLRNPLPSVAPPADGSRDGPLTSIVVVTHGGLAFTRMALESVLENTPPGSYELIVVDNASPDSTPWYLRALSELNPSVRIILNDENRGFSAASNQGLSAAEGEVLVLLNSDTVVPEGWLAPLLGHLADGVCGLVGPTTNEAPNEARIETGYETYGEMSAFAAERRRAFAGQSFEIAVATMFCAAMRRDTLDEVGLLDERYGTGLVEDDDYSMRVRQCGREVRCAKDAFVHHFGGATFSRVRSRLQYEVLLSENGRQFEKKWGLDWSRYSADAYAQGEDAARSSVRALVEQAVPAGATVAAITYGDPALLELGDRRGWHFPHAADGLPLGYNPGNSAEAIRHLEETREAGAEYLVVPESAFWWLDHYVGFAQYLRDRHDVLVRDESAIIFALRRSAVPREETPTACCIAGMHRSGTSMVAQVLAAAGMWLGDPGELFAATPDNPHGHWEHGGFVALNERLLDRLGGAWDVPPQVSGEWWLRDDIRALESEGRELTEGLSYQPWWGWKDPRNSLTLPFWLRVAGDLRVIACVRHPMAVAQSLHRRGMHSRRLSLPLWLTYNERVLNSGATELLVVDYDRILADPEAELTRLLAFAHGEADTEALTAAMAAIDQPARHAQAENGAALPEALRSVHERLQALAATPWEGRAAPCPAPAGTL